MSRETVGRVRRAGATGRLTLRADGGFWSRKVIGACIDYDVDFSITVTRQPVSPKAVEAIDESAWIDIDYTDSGTAQVAAMRLDRWRLIVRRTRIDNDPRPPSCSRHGGTTRS